MEKYKYRLGERVVVTGSWVMYSHDKKPEQPSDFIGIIGVITRIPRKKNQKVCDLYYEVIANDGCTIMACESFDDRFEKRHSDHNWGMNIIRPLKPHERAALDNALDPRAIAFLA